MWDWFEVGGRWDGLIETSDVRVNSARISDISHVDPERVHDVLTPDGVWHESETFHEDIVSDEHPWGTFVEDETFTEQFYERFLAPYQDCTAYVIDYHR